MTLGISCINLCRLILINSCPKLPLENTSAGLVVLKNRSHQSWKLELLGCHEERKNCWAEWSITLAWPHGKWYQGHYKPLHCCYYWCCWILGIFENGPSWDNKVLTSPLSNKTREMCVWNVWYVEDKDDDSIASISSMWSAGRGGLKRKKNIWNCFQIWSLIS